MSTSDCAAMIITTVADLEAARILAREILNQRLAACVQWYPIESMYRWEGKIEHDREILLQAKTTATGATALQQYIRQHHPYETPEIIVLPISDGHPDYLNWIRHNVVESD